MKTALIALSTLLFAFNSITDSYIERLGVKGPLEFNNITFKLAWTDMPNENYYIQEYLIEGEKPESFNEMLTIHLFTTDINTLEAVGQKINELKIRKNTDAVCNYQVTESPDGKEFIVDFIMGESKDDRMTVVEFNIYRYKQIEIFNNKKAIIVYAYSKRSYGNNITTFFKTLKDERKKYLKEMIATEIPVVSIINN